MGSLGSKFVQCICVNFPAEGSLLITTEIKPFETRIAKLDFNVAFRRNVNDLYFEARIIMNNFPQVFKIRSRTIMDDASHDFTSPYAADKAPDSSNIFG
ncbi:MAG: hypothetical protein JWQ04_1355 [Pedosphaera sp.]|nr:hypothetical protein [Pedosphaera sp.]